jgi:voltage-gated sodium channel
MRQAWTNPNLSPKHSSEKKLARQRSVVPATLNLKSNNAQPRHFRSAERNSSLLSITTQNREALLNKSIAVVIVVNTIFLGLETDWSNSNSPAKDRIFWILVESIMIVIFIAEIVARMYIERWRWLCSVWNWLDVCLVILSVIETWILNFMDESGRLRVLGLIRCVRMVRLIRVFRLVRMFSPLYATVMAFKEALSGLLSICAIMVGGIYVCAIFITGVVGRGEMAELELGSNTGSERFGSVTWSMYSLFELLTLEGWVDVARPIIEQQPGMAFFFFSFVMVFTFGLLQMVVAVVVEKTLLNAKRSEQLGAQKLQQKVGMQLQSLREAFVKCDINNDETIDRDEFEEAMKTIADEGNLKSCFEALGIPIDDALMLFDILDADLSGQLDMDEFLNGVARVVHASDANFDRLATHAMMTGLRKQFRGFQERIKQDLDKGPRTLTLSSMEAYDGGWLMKPLTPPAWT